LSYLRVPPDAWVFAFDTGHAGDVMPMMRASMEELYAHMAERGAPSHRTMTRDYETYRDLAYVRHQTEQLAAQIALAAQVRG
jgi:hypothetical protein